MAGNRRRVRPVTAFRSRLDRLSPAQSRALNIAVAVLIVIGSVTLYNVLHGWIAAVVAIVLWSLFLVLAFRYWWRGRYRR